MIATGSTAANNDITSNTFHLVASPLGSLISGFGAPIGGYDLVGPAESVHPSAKPLWLALRNAGKKVVTATFPGAMALMLSCPACRAVPLFNHPQNARSTTPCRSESSEEWEPEDSR